VVAEVDDCSGGSVTGERRQHQRGGVVGVQVEAMDERRRLREQDDQVGERDEREQPDEAGRRR